jgi:hypothetical protein
MTSENLGLLAIAGVLFGLQAFLGGPIARSVAGLFARMSSPKSEQSQESPRRTPAE